MRAGRQALIALALAGCDAAPTTGVDVTVEGVWIARAEGLPATVAREGFARPELRRVVARSLSFTASDGAWTWCLFDLRDGQPAEALADPCGCARSAGDDCVGGVARVADALVPGGLADVVLQHDDARADLVGVLTVVPSTDGERLGLHLASARDDAERRPDVTTGLQGFVWAGAEGLGWYRRP